MNNDEYTIAECLRGDGFDNVDECDWSWQDYRAMVEMRLARDDSERLCSFFQGMTSLSNKAMKVISLALDPSDDLIQFLGHRGMSMYALSQYLRRSGWSKYSIAKAYLEISDFLKNFGKT